MRGSGIWRNLIYVFLALALILIVVQIFAAWQMQSITTDATRGAQSAGQKDVTLQKAREDLISAQIGNESKNALETFASQFGALTATLVTLSGAILAFRSYLDAREKEQKDRFESQETERRDRAEARERNGRIAWPSRSARRFRVWWGMNRGSGSSEPPDYSRSLRWIESIFTCNR